MLNVWIAKIGAFIGVESGSTGHAEKAISAVGGFIGILLTMWISLHYLGSQGAALLVASMGASAVLLFAVPHGALSQPWPLVGGHMVSAVIGVGCAQLVSSTLIAAPLAVALAIAAMHYLRCIHPPGGATALTAVIGGSELHALGYQFVLTPVLLNASVMLLTAIALNYAFPWRRYPACLRKQVATPAVNAETAEPLSHGDLEYALGEIGSYVDVTEDDLAKIYQLAVMHHARSYVVQPGPIAVGNFYSNGECGAQWSVRQVTGMQEHADDAQVSFRVVAGDGQGVANSTALAEFADWMKYEVRLENGAWHRAMQT
ncbi:MAG TPA: HPP family protein [Gallionella sp.]|nr:HPP family protein [Gallionella sp.]